MLVDNYAVQTMVDEIQATEQYYSVSCGTFYYILQRQFFLSAKLTIKSTVPCPWPA